MSKKLLTIVFILLVALLSLFVLLKSSVDKGLNDNVSSETTQNGKKEFFDNVNGVSTSYSSPLNFELTYKDIPSEPMTTWYDVVFDTKNQLPQVYVVAREESLMQQLHGSTINAGLRYGVSLAKSQGYIPDDVEVSPMTRTFESNDIEFTVRQVVYNDILDLSAVTGVLMRNDYTVTATLFYSNFESFRPSVSLSHEREAVSLVTDLLLNTEVSEVR